MRCERVQGISGCGLPMKNVLEIFHQGLQALLICLIISCTVSLINGIVDGTLCEQILDIVTYVDVRYLKDAVGSFHSLAWKLSSILVQMCVVLLSVVI